MKCGLTRQDDTNVHKALREALVNVLVHADYQGTGGIVIEKQKTSIRFSNPGGLRIPLELALRGGHSDPRNTTLMRMFSLIGLGERQGAGLPAIQKAWKEAHWRALTSLVNKELLVAQGQGRGMRYVLDENSINSEASSINNELSLVNRDAELQKRFMSIAEPARQSKRLSPEVMEELILQLCALTPLSLQEIAEILQRDKTGLRNNHLSRLIRENKLKYRYPGQVNHPQQTYETNRSNK